MPVRIIVTAGTTHDSTQAGALIEGIAAEVLLADRGYDSNEIVAAAMRNGMKVCIPPKRNRKEMREYDAHLYKLRHLVENAFLLLKRWRGNATRYAKHTASFVAAVQIRCIAIWCSVLA
jgi:transposase